MSIKNYLKNLQLTLISLLILTTPYFIAPHFPILISTLVLLIALVQKQFNIKSLLQEKTILYLFIFILIIYLSFIWSESKEPFGGDYKIVFDAYLPYLIIIPSIYFSNLSKNNLITLLYLFIIAPTIYVFIYYTNSLDITHIYSYHYDRANGSYYLYVDLIANLFIAISTILIYILSLNNLLNKKYFIAFILFLLFLFYAGSLVIDEQTSTRLITLVLISSMLFITCFINFKKIKYLIILLITLISIIYIYQSSSFQKGFSEIKIASQEHKFQGSWGHRINLALYGIDMFIENPIIGQGTADISNKMRIIQKNNSDDLLYPIVHFHNNHILILVQIGIIGYLVFFLFFLSLYRIKIEDKNIHYFKQSVIVIFILIMMGEHYLQWINVSTYFAILISIFLKIKRDYNS